MSDTNETFLDKFLGRIVRLAGVNLPRRSAINFVGGSVADDATGDQTTVTLTGVGSGQAVIFASPSISSIISTKAGASHTDTSKDGTTNFGVDNDATGVGCEDDYTTVGGGNSNRSRALAATVAGGRDNDAFGAYAAIPGGWNNTAGGHAACAIGEDNVSGGNWGLCAGKACQTTADYSSAMGRQGKSRYAGHHVVGIPSFANVGDAQSGILMYSGSTPGSGAGEAVELTGSTLALLHNGVFYLRVVVVAGGLISAALKTRFFEQTFSISVTSGGTVTLAGNTGQVTKGDTETSTWTLTVAAAGGGPPTLTFSTGSTTSAARVVARCELIEVGLA